jgi:hypothetical protein
VRDVCCLICLTVINHNSINQMSQTEVVRYYQQAGDTWLQAIPPSPDLQSRVFFYTSSAPCTKETMYDLVRYLIALSRSLPEHYVPIEPCVRFHVESGFNPYELKDKADNEVSVIKGLKLDELLKDENDTVRVNFNVPCWLPKGYTRDASYFAHIRYFQ